MEEISSGLNDLVSPLNSTAKRKIISVEPDRRKLI
jgi:hypothetical protein